MGMGFPKNLRETGSLKPITPKFNGLKEAQKPMDSPCVLQGGPQKTIMGV